MVFKEMEDYYKYFKDISKLNISLITTSKNSTEFLFLLKSFKIYFNKFN